MNCSTVRVVHELKALPVGPFSLRFSPACSFPSWSTTNGVVPKARRGSVNCLWNAITSLARSMSPAVASPIESMMMALASYFFTNALALANAFSVDVPSAEKYRA